MVSSLRRAAQMCFCPYAEVLLVRACLCLGVGLEWGDGTQCPQAQVLPR